MLKRYQTVTFGENSKVTLSARMKLVPAVYLNLKCITVPSNLIPIASLTQSIEN